MVLLRDQFSYDITQCLLNHCLFWFRVSLTLSPSAFFDIRLMWDQRSKVRMLQWPLLRSFRRRPETWYSTQWSSEQYSRIVKVPVTAQLFLCAVCMFSKVCLGFLWVRWLCLSHWPNYPSASCNGQGASPGCSPIFHSDSSVSSTGNGPQLPESYYITTTTLTIVMKLCNNDIILFTHACILMVCGHK